MPNPWVVGVYPHSAKFPVQEHNYCHISRMTVVLSSWYRLLWACYLLQLDSVMLSSWIDIQLSVVTDLFVWHYCSRIWLCESIVRNFALAPLNLRWLTWYWVHYTNGGCWCVKEMLPHVSQNALQNFQSLHVLGPNSIHTFALSVICSTYSEHTRSEFLVQRERSWWQCQNHDFARVQSAACTSLTNNKCLLSENNL